MADAQVLSYDFYTFRLNNMFNVNPAYAGKGDGLNAVLSAQSQNKGVAFANKNLMLGVYSKVSKKQALGGRLISDTRGAFQILKADVSYAYIAKILDESSLTFGLSAGILNNNMLVNRIENYESLDQTDPTLNRSYYNTTQFSAGAGLLYNYKNLDVSVSLPHMLTTNEPLNGYLHGAVFYTIKAGNDFKVTPWLCYQNIPVTKSVTSLNLKTMYKDVIWVQAGYQTNRSVSAMLGVKIENLSLGYGFRFNNKDFRTVSSGSHEVTLALKLPQRGKTLGSSPISDNASLNEIIARLDKLSKEAVTAKNKENIKAELEKIKLLLQKAEVDNSSPEKAQEVSKQLLLIDEKLKMIEKNLLNEN
ncbi:MAG: putative rane protein [Bacteroidetes bacterium]|nr:putative rane protein [Bacteroidota bacterium]